MRVLSTTSQCRSSSLQGHLHLDGRVEPAGAVRIARSKEELGERSGHVIPELARITGFAVGHGAPSFVWVVAIAES